MALLAACDTATRRELLAETGLLEGDVETLEAIAGGTPGDGAAIPASKALAELLQGPYASAWQGEGDPAEAFRNLMKDGALMEKLRALLFDGTPSALRLEPDRLLCLVFNEGYRLGQLHFGVGKDKETANFVLSQHDDAFARALEDHIPKRTEALLAIYNDRAHPRWGWYESTLRRHGPVTANLLLAVRLHEITPFGKEAPWLSLREIALCVSPENPFDLLPDLCSAADGCFERKELERLPVTMADMEGRNPASPSTRVRPIGV